MQRPRCLCQQAHRRWAMIWDQDLRPSKDGHCNSRPRGQFIGVKMVRMAHPKIGSPIQENHVLVPLVHGILGYAPKSPASLKQHQATSNSLQHQTTRGQASVRRLLPLQRHEGRLQRHAGREGTMGSPPGIVGHWQHGNVGSSIFGYPLVN